MTETSIEQRIIRMHSYFVTEGEHPNTYDRVASLAARMLDVAVVAVALFDERDVYFQSVISPDGEAPAYCETLCRCVAEDGAPVWSLAGRVDPCGSGDALRAGVPIRSSGGHMVGAVCVGDERPRVLDEDERAMLMDLVAFASEEFERGRRQALAVREAEALKSSERHFRELLDIAPVLVWMTDKDHQNVFFNRNWLEFTGRPLDRELGTGWLTGLHPDDEERARRQFDRAHAEGKPYSIEYRLLRHDGQYRWLFEIGRALHGADGAYRGHVGGAVEITDLKIAEARLEERTLELERSNSALEQFAAVTAHDLRAPLRHILQFAELLREEYRERLGTDQSDYADHIVEAVHRMRSIVTSLLALARIPVTATREHFEMFALADAVEQAHASVGVSALEVRHDSLPQVYGVRGLITQLMQNLFDNSIKYAAGDPPVALIETQEDGERIRICVSDHGPGIAPEDAETVFRVFARICDDDSIPGMGIGLTLCKRIAELHGSDIMLDTDYREGARFCFSLARGLQVGQCAPRAERQT